MTDDVDTIRAILAVREQAIARRDAAATIAAMAPGAVSYDLPPPLAYVHDPAAAATGLNGWFATWEGPITFEMPEATVLVSGDLAVAYGLKRLRGRSKSAGLHESWFRNTVVFRRDGGRWRIVHEHASYPLRMDGTGLAAVDLQPD